MKTLRVKYPCGCYKLITYYTKKYFRSVLRPEVAVGNFYKERWVTCERHKGKPLIVVTRDKAEYKNETQN